MFRLPVFCPAAILCLFLLLSIPVQAQTGYAGLPQEAVQILIKQPKLTQKDIDAAIKIIPQMKASKGARLPSDVYKSAGVTEERMGYIMAKLSTLQAIDLPTEQQQMFFSMAGYPKELYPTDAEKTLMRKNIKQLLAVMTKVD